MDMTGMDAIELGCGTGYVSAWMARRGARVTGIDVSAGAAGHRAAAEGEHGLDVTFLEGNAEATGLPDAAFDFAISEYGAAIWCDPDLWLPEAHRLLRPGGTLVFLGNHPMTIITTPPNGAPCERVLHRPYRGADGRRLDGCGDRPRRDRVQPHDLGLDGAVRSVGFDVLRYQELFAPGTRPRTGSPSPGPGQGLPGRTGLVAAPPVMSACGLLRRQSRGPTFPTETVEDRDHMPMQAHEIESLLRESFPDATIQVSGDDGVHMAAMVIDESFRGMNRVQQQRAVYAALKGKMDGANGELHALAR
jgi:acid stress-induced BolA-like protein IbaG/YrbA/SAM-dependent methyltransferase